MTLPSNPTPDARHSGLVAVVTGASRGIGAGLATHVASRGFRLGLCARSVPEVPVGADVVAEAVDVTDPVAIDSFAAAVVARFGRIDLWVNNAGLLEPIGPLADADPTDLQRHVAVNVLGVVHGSATFARHVRSRPGVGSLVNMSSGAATSASRGWAVYCASKAAVEMATEVIGLEERDAGLLDFAVTPGVVDTDMQALIRATPVESFPDVARFHRIHEAGAFATADWVAHSILECCVDPLSRLEPEDGRGAVHFRVPDPVARP